MLLQLRKKMKQTLLNHIRRVINRWLFFETLLLLLATIFAMKKSYTLRKSLQTLSSSPCRTPILLRQTPFALSTTSNSIPESLSSSLPSLLEIFIEYYLQSCRCSLMIETKFSYALNISTSHICASLSDSSYVCGSLS